MEYYGGLSHAVVGEHVKLGGGSWATVSREPIGVVGIDQFEIKMSNYSRLKL